MYPSPANSTIGTMISSANTTSVNKTATTAAFASTISPDGSTVNGRAVDWPATPHFFTSGRVIVLYLGDNTQVLLAISDVMGAQFAGGEFVIA